MKLCQWMRVFIHTLVILAVVLSFSHRLDGGDLETSVRVKRYAWGFDWIHIPNTWNIAMNDERITVWIVYVEKGAHIQQWISQFDAWEYNHCYNIKFHFCFSSYVFFFFRYSFVRPYAAATVVHMLKYSKKWEIVWEKRKTFRHGQWPNVHTPNKKKSVLVHLYKCVCGHTHTHFLR